MTFRDDIAADLAEIFGYGELTKLVAYLPVGGQSKNIQALIEFAGKGPNVSHQYSADVIDVLVLGADVPDPQEGDTITFDGKIWRVRVNDVDFAVRGDGFTWRFFATRDEKRVF